MKEQLNINFFEHIIICKPKTIFCLNTEDIKPNKRDKIQRADDKFVIINTNNISFARMMLLLAFILLLISIPFLKSNEYILFLPSIPFLIGTWFWALYYCNPPKNIVLNRIEGTISYPKKNFYRTPTTVPFSEIEMFEQSDKRATYNDEYGSREYSRYRHLYFRHSKTDTVLPLFSVQIADFKIANSNLDKLYQIRSFYTWYMDKNRPLPPGTAFDLFREKDFDRRHNEGFIPPLYNSLIRTPEANYKQKKIKKSFLEK
ncbi:hypothetical protein [Tenacibaculum finnmarkense]|uniref:hypothetical protein n=1 Tax=Tenacibaculum finnmarkense TaxID=2781243 RepID=UPI001E33F7E6|nr:hypothetical protein [Tenacibaculum finnmarkense]MCD8423638.1 hypothetical protein [Tenacibaculum finnmarkense genomovar ulcerans]MCG8239750.1 hypothetical protein [Tenacibaculum finnmarkense genomovar ulcerans]